MTEKIQVPAFKTEAEEADWWFEHREEHDARMLKAMEEGTTLRLADVLREHGLLLEGLKEVAVPVRDEDVELARRQAIGAGMEYHEYLGKLLHEALTKSDAA